MSDDDATAAIEKFYEHLDQLADEAGVELDPAEQQRVFRMSVANGIGPDSTVEAFNDL
jgi:hypothetical protein